MIRLSAYSTCAVVGAAIPFVATLDAGQSNVSPSLAYHTSSRMAPVDANMPADELETLRSQIWALTQQGGTIHCMAEGVTAPCIDTAAFD